MITPLKAIYARKPRLALLAQHIYHMMEKGLSLDPELRLLIPAQASRLNGCAFCHDSDLARAVGQRLGLERFQALDSYKTSPLFTDRDRAALSFAEEATCERGVSDATFVALRAHFSETEVVEIAWLNAAENYFNLQAAVLGIPSDELLSIALERGRS